MNQQAMENEQKLTLHYMIDSLWGAKTANSIAKMAMTKAFTRQERLEKIILYPLMEDKKKLKGFPPADFSGKVYVKPLFFSRYKDRTIYGRELCSLLHDLAYASPIMILRAFLLAFRLEKNDKVFIRGLESLVGFYLGNLITNSEYGFERHNYTFGRYKLLDFFFRKMIRRAKFVVTISEFTKQNWMSHGIAEDKIIVLSSAVDMEDFDRVSDNKKQLREAFGLPNDKRIITYSGGLYENRGIEELLNCAVRFSDHLFLFLGGTPEQIERFNLFIKSRFTKQLPNVLFKGYVRHHEIASYLKASDILVAPYSKKVKTLQHMSPIKVIEYLATQVPVIVSDLPSIRAVITEDEVTFSRADSADDLCTKIKWVFNNYQLAEGKAIKAYQKVSNLTWDRRAMRIVDLFLN